MFHILLSFDAANARTYITNTVCPTMFYLVMYFTIAADARPFMSRTFCLNEIYLVMIDADARAFISTVICPTMFSIVLRFPLRDFTLFFQYNILP